MKLWFADEIRNSWNIVVGQPHKQMFKIIQTPRVCPVILELYPSNKLHIGAFITSFAFVINTGDIHLSSGELNARKQFPYRLLRARSEKPSLVNSAILEYQSRHLVGVLSCCFVRLTWPKGPYGRHLQLSKIHWRPEFCSNLTWPEDPVTSREQRAWRHVTFGGKTQSFLWFSSIATQICVTFTGIKRYSKPMMMQISKYLKLQMADESVHRHWVSGQRCASRRCHTASTRSTGNAYVCGLGNTILYHTVWRTWLFVAYSDQRWLYYQFSLHNLYVSFIEGWENVLFELGSERVKLIRNNNCKEISSIAVFSKSRVCFGRTEFGDV